MIAVVREAARRSSRNSSLTIRWPELLQFVRTESSISSGTDGRKPLPSEEGTDLLGGCTDPQVDGLNSILSAGITSIDAFHGFVGLPWWATIGLVGFGVRTAMLPVALKSMKASAALLPLWRRARQESMIGQRGMISDKESTEIQQSKASAADFLGIATRFQSLRKQIKAPHPFWIVGGPLLQLPVFVTAMASVRTMSLQKWHGFENGGVAWFSDLTLPAVDLTTLTAPMGPHGVALPLGIVFCMLANIETSFPSTTFSPSKPSQARDTEKQDIYNHQSHAEGALMPWVLGKVRLFMEWMLVPLFVVSLQLPHAALCYWTSSSCFALIQNRLLRLDSIRSRFGLPSRGQVGKPADVAGVIGIGSTALEEKPELSQMMLSNQTFQNSEDLAKEGINEDDLYRLFHQAAEFQAQGKPSDAARILGSILASCPNDPRALFAFGQIQSSLKDWNAASEAFLRAVEFETDAKQQSRIWFSAAVSLFQGRKYEDALLAFKQVHDCEEAGDALRIKAWVSAAALLEKEGRVDEALTLLARAVEKEPKVEELYVVPLLQRLGRKR